MLLIRNNQVRHQNNSKFIKFQFYYHTNLLFQLYINIFTLSTDFGIGGNRLSLMRFQTVISVFWSSARRF